MHRMAISLALLLAVGACTLLQKQTAAQQIDNINRGVTLVLTSTDQAYLAHVITKPQATSVSIVAHQLNPLLDSAAAAAASGDTAGADKTLTLVNSLLAALKAYVPPGAVAAPPATPPPSTATGAK